MYLWKIFSLFKEIFTFMKLEFNLVNFYVNVEGFKCSIIFLQLDVFMPDIFLFIVVSQQDVNILSDSYTINEINNFCFRKLKILKEIHRMYHILFTHNIKERY